MSQSPSPELDKWRLGAPLETAWSAFAKPGQKQLYHQVAGDETRRRLQYLNMVADLWQRLSSGELVACGWRVSPSPLDLPSVIPAAMFDSPPDKADLDISRFRFQSWSFDKVTVTQIGTNYSASATPVDRTQASAIQPVKRGRKPLFPLFVRAAKSAAQRDQAFLDRIQEKQVADIQGEAKALAPAQYPGMAMPGRSTVSRFVKEQRERGWPVLRDPENPEIPK